MRVILQEKVANLGNVGDQVMVKRGYGRNYLVPLGKAVFATKENIAEFEKNRAEFEKKAAQVLVEAQQKSEKLANKSFTIETQASEEGKLFGSIGPRDVANAVSQQGIEVAKSEVRMPRGPIRQVGEYEVDLQLHSEVITTIKINVIATSAVTQGQ